MLEAMIRRVRGVARRIDAALRTATRRVALVGGFLLRDVTRTRGELLAENAALRQQLIVVARTVKKPVFAPHERGLLVLLAQLRRRTFWRFRDAVAFAAFLQ